MRTRYALPTLRNVTRTLVAVSLLTLSTGITAQTLYVSDLDTYDGAQPFPVQDSIFKADLTAAGETYTVFNIVDGATPPTYAQLDAYERVIWFCGTDGTSLGFWNAIQDIRDYAQTGKKIWIIGQDLLYALHGAAPKTFVSGDFEYDVMGIEIYQAQSFADDGSLGVPQMDVDPAVASSFAPTLTWIFTTLWYADAAYTELENVQGIYNMGPAGYALAGIPSMVHHSDPGLFNVMSTLFNPTVIATTNGRVQFIEETLAYMNVNVGMAEIDSSIPALGFTNNPALDRVDVLCTEAIRNIQVYGPDGREVYANGGLNTMRSTLDMTAFSAGIYVVRAQTMSDKIVTGRLVKQ
jgi:hypothetical protein